MTLERSEVVTNCDNGHDMQNHSTRYGPVYWCSRCWATPQEVRQQQQQQREVVK